MKNALFLYMGFLLIGCVSASQQVIINTDDVDQSWILAHSYAAQCINHSFKNTEDRMFDLKYNWMYVQFIKEPTRIILVMHYRASSTPKAEELKNKIINYITDKTLYKPVIEKVDTVQHIGKEGIAPITKSVPDVEKVDRKPDQKTEKKNKSNKVNNVNFL